MDDRLCTASQIEEAIGKMAVAIAADFGTLADGEYALVGLHRSGVPLAERLMEKIVEKGCGKPAFGQLDVTMYRDDIGLRPTLPKIRETVMPFNVEGARVILVDDVFSSGRTIRAALDALTAFGRPAIIRLAVLIDRGTPEFPIRPDYTGMAMDVDPLRKIVVELAGNPAEDAVYVQDRGPVGAPSL